MNRLKITILEPFYGGSHRAWCEALREYSTHVIEVFGLHPKNWKWRMHAGAIELAEKANSVEAPDVYLCSDLMDVALFKSLLSDRRKEVPILLYFHENQFMYPRSGEDTDLKQNRDNHYGFMNYTSALVADKIAFNSAFHLRGFFSELDAFLALLPEGKYHRKKLQGLREKSEVLYPGVSVSQTHKEENPKSAVPVLLWNHRWEHDKNPDEFFETLIELKQEGVEFKLIVLGEQFRNSPHIFKEAEMALADSVLHWGFAADKKNYFQWLSRADILPVTSIHDFFGISVVEAMRCGVIPLLPNDLAYPEHLPADAKEELLYPRGEFKKALGNLIRSYGNIDRNTLREFVCKYDWKELVKWYDDCFESLKGR